MLLIACSSCVRAQTSDSRLTVACAVQASRNNPTPSKCDKQYQRGERLRGSCSEPGGERGEDDEEGRRWLKNGGRQDV